MDCPISELVIIHNSGLPIFSWLNPAKADIATGVTDSNSQDLIGGLFTAILTMSEDISGESGSIESIKMLRTIFKYALHTNLIFILGYDSHSPDYEPIVDAFLGDIIQEFSKQFVDHLNDEFLLDSDIFDSFSTYMEKAVTNDRWKIERTLTEILEDIQELLLDILGPMSVEMFKNNIRKQRKYGRKRDVDLNLLSSDLVYEISMFMDPTQAKQIGDEIKNKIRAR
jgi:hypothetical protein